MSTLQYVRVDIACDTIKNAIRSRSGLDQIKVMVSNLLLNSYLSKAVISPCNLPAAPTSTMDGYALHLPSNPDNTFKIVAILRAGSGEQCSSLYSGEAAYVTTGSIVPAGTDAVIPIEWTSSLPNNYIKIDRDITSGQFIRQIGQDVSTGQQVLTAKKKIEATDLALLISLGIDYVYVYRHIRIGICSSGDELIDINQPLSDRGYVRDSNRPMIIACLQQLNEPIDVIDLGIIRDQLEGADDSIAERLGKAAEELDVIVSSGGISMGSHDLIKQYLITNAVVHFQQVEMKPGKPTIFAQFGNCFIFALPGNPLSALCNFHLFVKPALRLLSNQLSVDGNLHTNVMCKIKGTYPCDPIRPVYQFAWIYWDHECNGLMAIPTIQSTHCSGSSRLLTAQQSNGIIHIPVQEESIRDGQLLPVTLIGPLDHFIPRQVQHHNQGNPHRCKATASADHFKKDSLGNLKACLLVCSDRAFRGEYQDESGPAAAKFLSDHGIEVTETVVIPDNWDMIRNEIISWTDKSECDVVFTIGGTGLSNRDITPDVTATILDKTIPSLVWAMLADGRQYTPYALLSRAQAGVRHKTLVINLVGSVKGCVQNLNSIVQVLPHAVSLLRQA